jgi:hypothetical protein
LAVLKVRVDEFVPPELSLRLVGEMDTQIGGESIERVTVPAKPARLAKFMVTLPELPF